MTTSEYLLSDADVIIKSSFMICNVIWKHHTFVYSHSVSKKEKVTTHCHKKNLVNYCIKTTCKQGLNNARSCGGPGPGHHNFRGPKIVLPSYKFTRQCYFLNFRISSGNILFCVFIHIFIVVFFN